VTTGLSNEHAAGSAGIDLTVVIPVYNDAATIALLCKQLKAALSPEGISFEILFVDDGSTDDSAQRLARLAREHAEVTVIELTGNFGQQIAVLCGLEQASGECCAVMDADLQDPPSALPHLWRARSPDFSAVFAGRRGRYQSLGRHFTSLMYRTLLHVLTGLPSDVGMYVLMERRLVKAIVEFPTQHPSLPAMIGCLGVPSISVPLKRMMRAEGRSTYTSLARVHAAIEGMTCWLNYRLQRHETPYLQAHGRDLVRTLTRARVTGEPDSHGTAPRTTYWRALPLRVVIAALIVLTLVDALDLRRHVRNETHPIARTLAIEHPHSLVRLRRLLIPFGALRLVALIALVANLSRDVVLRALLGGGGNTAGRHHDDRSKTHKHC